MNCQTQSAQSLQILHLSRCLVFAVTLIFTSARAEDVANNTVSVQLKSRQKLFNAGKNRVWQTIILANHLTQYDLNIGSEVNEEGKLINTFVGIANPQQSWWCNGFMTMKVDDADVGQFPCRISIVEQGQQGCLEFLYQRPEGDLRCRFLLYPEDEMLYVEWACDGKNTEAKHLEVICVPAVANMLTGQTAKDLGTRRAAQTSAQTFVEKKDEAEAKANPAKGNPEKENWALLLDQVWDLADASKRAAPLRNGVTGPAGVVFHPVAQMGLRYEIDPVYVRTHATYPAEANLVRLALCEFRKLENKAGYQTLKEKVPAVMERMARLTSTPREMTEATSNSLQRLADSVLKPAGEQKGKTSSELQLRLQRFLDAKTKWDQERTFAPLAAERALRAAYDQFYFEAERLGRPARKTGTILVVKGLNNLLYKIDAVRMKYPRLMQEVKNAYVRKDANYGFYVDYFPSSRKEIMRFDAIVLANADVEALQEEGLELLLPYLENGGGLVVLGGYHSYGLSSVYETRLGSVLPVKGERFDLQPLGTAETAGKKPSSSSGLAGPQGAPLQPMGKDSPFIENLKWEQKPMCYWQHFVKPSKNAQVHISAGAQSFLITGQYGKGRIGAFTGTVLGLPAREGTPFWEWESWPELLGRVLAWAADKPAK
ncbi:MAG: hypothetical protein HY360_19940 [Verrucomicrobia bacterium]|nr:hypothetical protein [Verrucomicrobiota bacterium]